MTTIDTEKPETEALTTTKPQTIARSVSEFNYESALRLAEKMCKDGMAPKGLENKPGAVVGLMRYGHAIGLDEIVSLSWLTWINGKVGIMGDAAKALIRGAGALKPGTDFEETYSGKEFTDDWKVTVTSWRNGQERPFSTSFSFKEAVTAKLVRIWTYPSDDKEGGNWKKGDTVLQAAGRDGWNVVGPWARYTARQMKYRAIGFHARDFYSDILLGTVVAEELQDYPEIRENHATEVAKRFLKPGEQASVGPPGAYIIPASFVSTAVSGGETWHCPKHPGAATFSDIRGECCTECGEVKG